MVKVLWQKRELLLSLVKRDLKTRYKSSVLGFFWSVGKPLFISLVLILVFSIIFRFKLRGGDHAPPFSLHILAGMLAWSFLLGCVLESLGSILANIGLITKIRIDAEVIPAASIVSNLIHFALALLVYLAIFIAFGNRPGWEIILLPLIVLIQTIFVTALALLVSSLNVYYRDVSSVTEIVTNAGFYFTPIIYPLYLAEEMLFKFLQDKQVNLAAEWAHRLTLLFFLNPMSSIVIAYRRVLLIPAYREGKEMADSHLFYALLFSLGMALVLYFFALKVFRRLSPYFADEY